MPHERLPHLKILPVSAPAPLRLAYDDFLLSREAMRCTPKRLAHYPNNAAQKGWIPQGVAATDGHINVGCTALKVARPFFRLDRRKGNSRESSGRDPTEVRQARWWTV
jgi:hypothetical protein